MDFSHLRRVPGSYGTALSIDSLLEQAVDNHRNTGRKQLIFIIGPLGIGKSTNLSLIFDRLQTLTELNDQNAKLAICTFEGAQKIAARIKRMADETRIKSNPLMVGLDPSHTSGYYTARDYRAGSIVMAEILKMALAQFDFLVVEVPGVGSMDRGMSALRQMVRNQRSGGYKVWVIALTTTAELFRRGQRKRWNKSPLKQTVGGTGLGTTVAYEDLIQCLAAYYQQRKKPVIPHLRVPNLYRRYIGITLQVLAVEYYPWLMEEYYKISPDRVLVCRNHKTGVSLHGEDYSIFNFESSLTEPDIEALMKVLNM